MCDEKIEKTEKKEKKSPLKNVPPRYFQTMISGLLTTYSSMPEEPRYLVARDLLGHVRASLIYMDRMSAEFDLYSRQKNEKGEYQYVQTKVKYWEVLEDCESDMERAIQALKVTKSNSEGIILLGTVMDRLKQIVAVENMVSEEITYIGNPLHTQSLEEDTLSRYKQVD